MRTAPKPRAPRPPRYAARIRASRMIYRDESRLMENSNATARSRVRASSSPGACQVSEPSLSSSHVLLKSGSHGAHGPARNLEEDLSLAIPRLRFTDVRRSLIQLLPERFFFGIAQPVRDFRPIHERRQAFRDANVGTR